MKKNYKADNIELRKIYDSMDKTNTWLFKELEKAMKESRTFRLRIFLLEMITIVMIGIVGLTTDLVWIYWVLIATFATYMITDAVTMHRKHKRWRKQWEKNQSSDAD